MHIFDISLPESWKQAFLEFLNFYIYFFVAFLFILDYIVNHRIGQARIIDFFEKLYFRYRLIRYERIPRLWREFLDESVPAHIISFLKLINSPYHQIYIDRRARLAERAEEVLEIFQDYSVSAIIRYNRADILMHFIQVYIYPYERYSFLANLFAVPTWFFYFDVNYKFLKQKSPHKNARKDLRIFISHMVPFLTGEALSYKFEIDFEERIITRTLLRAEYRDAVKPIEKISRKKPLLALGGRYRSSTATMLLNLYNFQKKLETKKDKTFYTGHFFVFMGR
jgi:hypothetical protein